MNPTTGTVELLAHTAQALGAVGFFALWLLASATTFALVWGIGRAFDAWRESLA